MGLNIKPGLIDMLTMHLLRYSQKKGRPTLCTSMSFSIFSMIWSTSRRSDGRAWRGWDIFAFVIARCVSNLQMLVSLLKDIFRDLVLKPSDVRSLSLVGVFLLVMLSPARLQESRFPLTAPLPDRNC